MLRKHVSPIVAVLAIVLLLGAIAGVYLLLMRHQADTLAMPVVKNDPYAGQYQTPAKPPYPDGVPPAP